ncbi:MAG: FHA domain-containing protein [Planctomycetales bacterium]
MRKRTVFLSTIPPIEIRPPSRSELSMDAKLIIFDKDGGKKLIRLKSLPAVLGRGREADLTVAHRLISRAHCEFYEVEGTLCIRDLGSLNGTFVGDTKIKEASLESGDILLIGSAKFEVVIKDSEDPLMPPGKANKKGGRKDGPKKGGKKGGPKGGGKKSAAVQGSGFLLDFLNDDDETVSSKQTQTIPGKKAGKKAGDKDDPKARLLAAQKERQAKKKSATKDDELEDLPKLKPKNAKIEDADEEDLEDFIMGLE